MTPLLNVAAELDCSFSVTEFQRKPPPQALIRLGDHPRVRRRWFPHERLRKVEGRSAFPCRLRWTDLRGRPFATISPAPASTFTCYWVGERQKLVWHGTQQRAEVYGLRQ